MEDASGALTRIVRSMAHSALTPVFVGLRAGLHLLFVGLVILVIVRGLLDPAPTTATIIVALSALLLVTYAIGAYRGERASGHTQTGRFSVGSNDDPDATDALPSTRPSILLWLLVLTLEWMALLAFSVEAAYLVFPLFFLYLHLLGRRWGPVAVVISTAVAIWGLGMYNGWSLGGIVGPLIGAGVALLIGLGYQALSREAVQREQLMRTLIATQGQLAATEHESGVLAERARLAREIHDTVAQGLSSIQMLLHAAERADPNRAGVEHIQLARETAASNLADARRFIQELTPPDLDDRGLGGALRRLAADQWKAQGLNVTVNVSDQRALPMHLQTALLRIAQGAIANVIQHAHTTTATITLDADGPLLRFSIADDGSGFDHEHSADDTAGRSDSFGLVATRERAEQLGGRLLVSSAPGQGTTVTVELAQEQQA